MATARLVPIIKFKTFFLLFGDIFHYRNPFWCHLLQFHFLPTSSFDGKIHTSNELSFLLDSLYYDHNRTNIYTLVCTCEFTWINRSFSTWTVPMCQLFAESTETLPASPRCNGGNAEVLSGVVRHGFEGRRSLVDLWDAWTVNLSGNHYIPTRNAQTYIDQLDKRMHYNYIFIYYIISL